MDHSRSERTGGSPDAIISHYDKGEDFFGLVLGLELIYPCALFEGDDAALGAKSLETACTSGKSGWRSDRSRVPTLSRLSAMGFRMGMVSLLRMSFVKKY